MLLSALEEKEKERKDKSRAVLIFAAACANQFRFLTFLIALCDEISFFALSPNYFHHNPCWFMYKLVAGIERWWKILRWGLVFFSNVLRHRPITTCIMPLNLNKIIVVFQSISINASWCDMWHLHYKHGLRPTWKH